MKFQDEKDFLENIEIIIDTREHDNKILQHIIPYFKKKGIQYRKQKLEFGDYSFIWENKSFENELAIERKASLIELAGNFSNGRKQFEAEFQRAKEQGAKIILMIENGSYGGILLGNHNTQMNIKAYYGSLLSWRLKYDLYIDFVFEQHSGLHILWNFYYYLRNELRED